MNVYSDTLSHDAVLVWLTPASRDVIGGVQMRTAPPPDVAETVVLDEQVLVQVGTIPAGADEIAVTEALVVALPIPVLVLDAAPPGEAVAALQSVLLASVGDDRPVEEGVTAALLLSGINVASTLIPTEDVMVRIGLAVWDDLAVTDTAAAALTPAPVVSEAASPSEAVALVLHALFVAVADDGAPTESVLPLAHIALDVSELVDITERRFAATQRSRKIKIRGSSPAR